MSKIGDIRPRKRDTENLLKALLEKYEPMLIEQFKQESVIMQALAKAQKEKPCT